MLMDQVSVDFDFELLSFRCTPVVMWQVHVPSNLHHPNRQHLNKYQYIKNNIKIKYTQHTKYFWR